MIRCERGIGRPSRQTNGAASDICDIGLVFISLNNSANVSDVMSEARHNEVRIVARCRWPQQRPSSKNVVPGKGNEHRVLNVVIQGVAVTNALQCELSRKRKQFGQ